MRIIVAILAVALAPLHAHAWVKVTNLSNQPQSVTFAASGHQDTRVIAPNRTEMFIGTEGMLSLNDPAAIAKAHAAKPGFAGELLGDLVASNRTSRIPAKEGTSFVIWPDGRLLLQRYRGMGGKVF